MLLNSTKRTYGVFSKIASDLLLPLADNLAKKWLEQSKNPYREEIDQFNEILGFPGIYALNLSYEWGCTSGAFNKSGPPDLLRILDWPFPGLGETLCVIRQESPVGEYFNVTWPAVSGIFQAMAPGRFSVAINQAPFRRHGLTVAGDWLKNRYMVQQNYSLPPAHLLRHVFETAKNYNEAKKILSETPICIPVLYTLTGTKEGEGCVIERLENTSYIRALPEKGNRVGITNHFQSPFEKEGKGWAPRAVESQNRAAQINIIEYPGFSRPDFDWLSYPMINKLTRLCMIANAGDGRLMIQGYEQHGAVTEVFHL